MARTLVDLAGVLPAQRVERALDSCLAAETATLRGLLDVTLELAQRGRPGIALMRRLLDDRADGYVAPASELEACFLRILERAGIRAPVRQLDAGDDVGWVGRVDFAYPDEKILIELDGRRHHSAKLDLEADRVRDNRLVVGGWRVIRITWAQLHERPDEVVAVVRALLGSAAA